MNRMPVEKPIEYGVSESAVLELAARLRGVAPPETVARLGSSNRTDSREVCRDKRPDADDQWFGYLGM